MSSLFVGQAEMKKRSSSKASKTDWKRIRAMKDKDISSRRSIRRRMCDMSCVASCAGD